MKKGILLSGGYGTRLHPTTLAMNKHFLNIYSKPMIFYSISILMLANIKEILIIALSKDILLYKNLFGNGHRLGIKIKYEIQDFPGGIAESIKIADKFIGNDDFALMLGDNFFYSENLTKILSAAVKKLEGAVVFAYYVKNASEYGIIEFDKKKKVKSIKEKPKNPNSNFAITGLYFYKNVAKKMVSKIKPSKRGELEISSLNNLFLKNNKLDVEILGRGVAWLDTGSYEGLLEASNFVYSIEKRQTLLINCPEEIAYRKKWIDKRMLLKSANIYKNSSYGKYLLRISKESLYY